MAKYSTLKGLSRIILKNYGPSSEKAICRDDKGLYCISSSDESYPLKDNKKVITRIFPYYSLYQKYLDQRDKPHYYNMKWVDILEKNKGKIRLK